MQVQAYLSFEGRCEEALEFYRAAIGAEVQMLMRYSDNPEPPPGGLTPGTESKIMHSSFRVGETVLMASDGYCKGAAKFEGITLALSARDDAQAKQYFDALADGGSVQMPLTRTFFSSSFGMVADRFGVPWMIYVAA